MSVPAFIDVSEDVQTATLRIYFKGLGANLSEANGHHGLENDLGDIINVCDICFKEASDHDVESVMNSIVTLLVTVPIEKSEKLILAFCEKLSKAPNNKLSLVCVRVLNNLFHGLEERSPLRYNVYFNLVKVAAKTDNVTAVFSDVDKLKSWMSHCVSSTDKLQKLLRLLHEILLESKQSELASKVMIELLGTFTEDNASQARDDAHRCIVASLGDPNAFLLDHLLALKPVKFLEGELIHDLLTIFVSEKLSAYIQFYKTNEDFVSSSLGLNHESNMQKMRLLTFMQMAESKKELPFEVIQHELQIGSDAVEAFIVDVLKTKMVRVKIDHMNRKVIVTSTMHRTFGKPQWQHLKDILATWRSNLSQVGESLDHVISLHSSTASIKS